MLVSDSQVNAFAKALTPRVNELLICKLMESEAKAMIRKIEAPILARYAFRDDRGELITDSDFLYTCDDNERVAQYFDEVNDAIEADGWAIASRGQTPHLVIHCHRINIERSILNKIGDFVPGFDAQRCSASPKHWKQAIELTVNAVVSLSGYRKPAIKTTPKEYFAEVADLV